MIFNLVEAAQEFLSEIAPLVPAPEPVSYDMELPRLPNFFNQYAIYLLSIH
jgi:hypothetical protein